MQDCEILKRIDHTLLKQNATFSQVKRLCDEAAAYHMASVCLNPVFVERAVEYLQGKVPVCTVIGFPLGATTTGTKVHEARECLEHGCDEFDMVISVGLLKEKNFAAVLEDMLAVRQAVEGKILKVIVETCLLTQDEKRTMCELVCKARADFIKTSTGFSVAGAHVEDVQLFAQELQGRCKIKAAGGIRTREDMVRFLQAGADRIGCSSAQKAFSLPPVRD